MNSQTRRTARAIAIVTLMGLTLFILALLQYRWIGDVSQAERTRLRVSLDNAVQQFRTDFNAELRRLCLAFELEPDALAARRWDRLIERYDDWSGEERHTKLIEDVFLVIQRANGERELRRLDVGGGQWVPVEWPERLITARRQMDRRAPGRLPPPAAPRLSLWRVLAEDLLLVQPLIVPESESSAPETAGYLILALSREYFQDVFLPEMVRHYFSGQAETDYDVAVMAGRGQRKVLYSLDPQSVARLLEKPDVRSRILRDRSDLPPAFAAGLPARGEPSAAGEPQSAPPRFPLARRFRRAPVLFGNESNDWEILARFRGGSLEEMVSKSRIRSLAVSFSVLLLLGVGMTVIVLGARRSHQLAELQMKFVAGVSHDLRTPLAVICSAADNLAAGVVDDSASRVKEYGALIRSEGRKLSAMIEQILHFASLQSGPRKAELQPCAVSDIVDTVLTDERPLIESLMVEVKTDIPADLPAALCDRTLLQQALRNLVSNSLKHAASGRWISIAARVPDSGENRISISVEDRGPGIDSEDLPHVFEPFYRGRSAATSGIPGSGLGLSVVEQSVSAMGGRVAVRSAPGHGTTFTLYLPSSGPAAAGIERKT